jgi:c-di-AMP phosphodiesterase-like protein
MEDLGGGGHQTMSGAQLTCSMDEAVEQLRNAIDKYLSVANIKYKPQNEAEAQ